jgi:uncharacterized protein YbgA (DUF1722 family)
MNGDMSTLSPVRIGISSCLLGERVRFDGNHKRDTFLVEVFGRHVTWVPVCPEVEMGLGVPRETMRLERHGSEVRLVAPTSGADHTDRLRTFAAQRLAALGRERLCGYILKKDSPSCGMERVRLYSSTGVPDRSGQGLFAAALMQCFPHMAEQKMTRAGLQQFHAQHKCMLVAHSQIGTRHVGRILAHPGQFPDEQAWAAAYLDGFTEVMRRTPTRRGHTNVLQHLAGYVSAPLDRDERAELTELIEQYRRGLLPLIVPVTLIRHYVRKFQVPYLLDQVYLSPHPHELLLLNHL